MQLVDLYGARASLWRSSCRALFMFFGPLNLGLDLLWLTHDAHRQCLRDKLCGTYVIRRGAVPAGEGPVSYPTYFIASMSFIVPEVVRDRGSNRSA